EEIEHRGVGAAQALAHRFDGAIAAFAPQHSASQARAKAVAVQISQGERLVRSAAQRVVDLLRCVHDCDDCRGTRSFGENAVQATRYTTEDLDRQGLPLDEVRMELGA